MRRVATAVVVAVLISAFSDNTGASKAKDTHGDRPAENLPAWLYFKQIVKRYALGRPAVDNDGRLRDVLEYNDWVLKYAADTSIPLLDLERAAHVLAQHRRLRPDYHSGDGLHLNANGYRALDDELVVTVRSIFGRR